VLLFGIYGIRICVRVVIVIHFVGSRSDTCAVRGSGITFST